ncbi:MAG TPA: hypothetical protein DCQ37_05600 [Desulfobacteraceae bacterium]|nr:hypothetical protein [Desulfobacteraceae bacterium]
MGKKNELKVERKISRDSALVLLEDLVKSFREGKACIQDGKSFITLKPAGDVDIELEASDKKGKQKLEISISWKEMPPNGKPLKISSYEPDILPDDEDKKESGDTEK